MLLTAPLVAMTFDANAQGPYLVVLPPWADADHVIQAAGGHIIGPELAWMGAFAASTDPDFILSVRASGALAVLSGRLPSFLCGA